MGMLLGTRRALFGAPVVVWSPALPTTDGGVLPEHWYRSDQGLWQDAGITPAIADGDVVGRWEDLSANADHINQAVVADKPTLQNGAGDLINGHPVIRFDGAGDVLLGPFTTGGVMNQPNTIFVIVMHDTGVGPDHFMDDDTVALSMRAGIAAGNLWNIYAGVSLADGAADANWHIWTILYNGAASQYWHEGVSKAAGNAGANVPNGLCLGAQVASNFWDGDIAEAILYDSNLSNADKNQIGQYLATRYGLSWTDI